MRAYTLIAVLMLLPGVLGAPPAAGAQQPAKVPRIGILSAATSVSSPVLDAFRQGLRELGWLEGQNILVDYRLAQGRSDRLPDFAGELVRLKVDIIVAEATQAVAAAKNATMTIPIVMISGSADPVGLGFVASLARPGGHVTGLSYSVGPEIVGKELGLLKEIVPKVHRVAILSNPANPVQPLLIREVNGAARSLGVQLQHLEVRGPDEFEGAFAAMANEGWEPSSWWQTRSSFSTERGSRTSQQEAACRQHTALALMWRPGASCLTGRACAISGGAAPRLWTGS